MRKFLLILVLPFFLFSYTLTYNTGEGHQGFNLVSQGKSGVEIEYLLKRVEIREVVRDGERMMEIEVPGIYLPNDEGKPNLPGDGRMIAIPNGARPYVEVISYDKEVIKGIEVEPAPRIPFEVEDEPLKYVRDEVVYSRDAYYPDEIVKISDVRKIRGIEYVILGITPFQYNPVKKELVVYKDIRVRVSWEGGEGEFGEERLRSPYFEPILQSNLINYGSLPKVDFGSKDLSGRGYEYVIIVPDDPDFIAWADTIRLWRMRQGIKTGVVRLSEIGGNDSAAIETFCDTAYSNWEVPPVAILLLSDYQSSGKAYGITSPRRPHPYSGTYVTDNVYADVDSPADSLPDIIFARITAQDASDLSTMIGKMLSYERNPVTDASFYYHPLMACGFQTERWFQLCIEVVRGFLYHVLGKEPIRQYNIYSGAPSPGDAWSTATNTDQVVAYFGESGLGYIPNTIPADIDWNSGSEDSINAVINNGTFMLLHRDHGYEGGWGEPNYNTGSLDGLTNDKYVFVFSINCLTGRFDYSSETFTEKFHRITHGALGLIAATQVSYSFVNDTYIFGLMDAMWPQFDPNFPESTFWYKENLMPAFASASGKYYLSASSWPYNTNNKPITYNLFHMHGDAFITLFSEVPETLYVDHPSTIVVPGGPVTITVTDPTKAAVDSARVCLWSVKEDSIWMRGWTDASGQITFNLNVHTPGDTVLVTVFKQNHKLYMGQIDVITANKPYPVYDSSAVVAGGDDVINPGEQVNATIWVRNQGTVDASGVYGILSTTDSYVTSISQDSAWYGDISAGGKVQGVPDYVFDVSITAPDQHVIVFDLTTHDVNDSVVVSHPTFTVNAPNIEYVSDSIVGGIWMPGDQVHIILEVSNSGHQGASVVSAVLETNDSYVSIDDGSSSYPDLGIGVNGDNSTDPFVCTASSSTPQGHVVNFKVIFTYNSGMVDTVEFSESIGVAGSDWADHDIGNTVLTVTRYGSIGYMDDTQGAGHGWQYPAGSNGLFIGSFAAGTSKDWVSDRFYSGPSGEKADWVTTTSPDGMVRMGLPGYSQQNSVAWFDDSGHPSSVGLKVKQVGWAWSNSGADDFVILKYVIYNEGGSDVSGIYFGVFLDLDIGTYYYDLAGRDEARSLAYVIGSSGSPYMGVRALDDSVSSNRRASVIYNSSDVYPWSGMPDSLMYLFMSGQFSRDTSSAGAEDYGAMAAVGPYNIPAGDSVIAAFALVGGNSLTELLRNSDTAFVYYWNSYTGIEPGREIPKVYSLEVPWIVNGSRIEIRYGLPEARKVEISVYDVSGRNIYSNKVMRNSGFYSEVIDVSKFASGVYFVKVKAGNRTDIRKTTIIR